MHADSEASELATEQALLRYAEQCLAEMRRRAERPPLHVATAGAGRALRAHQEARRGELSSPDQVAFFGRIDETGGVAWHIGYRHIHDAEHDPVVIEWRTPIAIPFYRANRHDTMGIVRRRSFTFDGKRLIGFDDEVFAPGTVLAEPQAPLSPALRSELDRRRSGELRQIVATIQAEQDELIRMPLNGLLVVQGGAGTGKTAIGLHRAAFLLYEYPRLRRQRILIVGPNQLFLDYIARVLPSLGEDAVTQRTVDQLIEGIRPTASEHREAQRLKGEARMADVLARAVFASQRPLRKTWYFQVDDVEFALTVAAAARLLDAVRARRLPHNHGREALREGLRTELYQSYRAALPKRAKPSKVSRVVEYLTATRQLEACLDRLWPALSAASVVRSLLTSRRLLSKAADGLLDGDEQRTIRRSRRSAASWSPSDVALVDEAETLVNGIIPSFGHVVVDEAQDLSPMQLRMTRRRSRGGSMTILGDLVQATGPWAPTSWSEPIQQLGSSARTVVHELPRAYRSNSQILGLANRLLSDMGLEIRRPVAVRTSSSRPTVRRVTPKDLAIAVVETVVDMARRWSSVALVATAGRLDRLQPRLVKAGLTVGDARNGSMSAPVTLITPELTKGLEFDAVVLVDPITFTGRYDPAGLRLLYVTMTRANQRLAVVHSAGLPECLGLGDAGLAAVQEPAANPPDGPSIPKGHAVLVRQGRASVAATCLCGWRYHGRDGVAQAQERGRLHLRQPLPGRTIAHPVVLLRNGRGWSAGCRCGWASSSDHYDRAWEAAAAHQRLR